MDRIDNDHQLFVVEVWCEIETRCAEVKDFNARRTFVLATKSLDGKRTEPVVAKKNIPQTDDTNGRHCTFTCAMSFPVASIV
jgi:hypothetical protein